MSDTQQLKQAFCELEIDYSEMPDMVIFPFLIQLDLENSILIPVPGQNQRFCYIISGIGEDTPLYTDLSHLVFSICDQIVASQIVNISVFIDGLEQEVIFGEDGNVELKTPAQPDPTTGCSGLKFDFALDKVDGVMNICFELTSPYPIGPIPVCLASGGLSATGLSICGPVCETGQTCLAMGYQKVTVCVPVTVTPFANAGTAITFCCGSPTVTTDMTPCPGTVNGSCTFKITQEMCVAVPVEFGATAVVGAPHVQCGDASAFDICTDCGVTDDIL